MEFSEIVDKKTTHEKQNQYIKFLNKIFNRNL